MQRSRVFSALLPVILLGLSAYLPIFVRVTPDGGSASAYANTGGNTVTFSVENTTSVGVTYNLQCTPAGQVSGCTPPANVFVDAFSTVNNVQVTYSVGGAGSGTVTLKATDAAISSHWDTGSFNVTVTAPPPPSVAPDGGSAVAGANSSSSVVFTVTNNSGSTKTYSFTCTPGGQVTGCPNPASQPINPGSANVTANFTTGSAGSGTVTLRATESGTGAFDDGSFTVTVSPPPVIGTLPWAYDKEDYGRCAVACFAAIHSQSTVPYFSLDTPRNVTLVYNGDRVDPKPFLMVDVQHPVGGGASPSQFWLQAQRGSGGPYIKFLNDSTTLKFTTPGDNSWVRLAGQFDVAANQIGSTGVYDIWITVSSYYGGALAYSVTSTKVTVVNENTSPVARGWTVAGIQRLYSQTTGVLGALITEGDGSATFYSGTGPYTRPAGEFAELTGSPGAGWTRKYPDSTTVTFNTDGCMSSVVDRFGNSTNVAPGPNCRAATVTDPQSLAIGLFYDANGLDYIIDPFGRRTEVTVNGSRLLTSVQDPDLVSTTFGYDGSNRLSTVTDRRGFATTIGYSSQSGKVSTVTAPSVEVVNSDGSVSTAAPVSTFEPWHMKGVPYGPTPVNATLRDTVFARVTDPGTHTAKFTVNRWGTPAVSTNALGRTDSTRFDANGLPARMRSAAGAVDSAEYSVSTGLPTYVKQSGLPARRILYNSGWGQPDSIRTDPVWSGERYFIGANGRVDSVRVAGGTTDEATTRYVYDARGRVTSVTDPLEKVVQTLAYQGTNGNLSTTTLPGDRTTTYGYDVYGRGTTVAPPGLATSTTYYSIINRPDSVQDGVNPVATRYGYNNLLLTSVTDPKGQVYGFTYNALGWLTQRTDPVGRSDQYQYSRDGELRYWTNRRSQRITRVYDVLHRPTGKSGDNTATESWAYPNDTVVVATSPVALDSVIANRHGQVLRASTAMAGQVYGLAYGYTEPGALSTVSPAGGGIGFTSRTYGWNARRGTLTGITLASAQTAIVHDVAAFPKSLTFPQGDQVERAYTSSHATGSIVTDAAYSSSVNRFAGLDAGNRTQRHIMSPTSGHQYSYDGLGRVVADSTLQNFETPCSTDPHNPPGENGADCTYDPSWILSAGPEFGYDAAGNRLDLGGSYNTGNRITGFNGCGYDTDFDGNLTSGCGSIYTWTAEGRLASTTVSGQTTTFDYDAGGRLVRSTGSVVRHFLWDGDNLLAELDGNGTAKIAEYSYYPGMDNPHALIVGSTKYYAHRDALGSVVALTDENKVLKRWYEYRAWGDLYNGADLAGFNGIDRARFKGALAIGSLYYMRNRWYDPNTGRFLSEDPIGLEGGINPYVFAGDDPVNGRDPSGLSQCYWIDRYVEVSVRDEVFWRTYKGSTSVGCTGSGSGSVIPRGLSFGPGLQGPASTRGSARVGGGSVQTAGREEGRRALQREIARVRFQAYRTCMGWASAAAGTAVAVGSTLVRTGLQMHSDIELDVATRTGRTGRIFWGWLEPQLARASRYVGGGWALAVIGLAAFDIKATQCMLETI